MEPTKMVTVYNFKLHRRAEDSPEYSTFKATRRAIAETFFGQAIEATAEDVAVETLDEHGAYHRRATGWGALND